MADGDDALSIDTSNTTNMFPPPAIAVVPRRHRCVGVVYFP